MVGDSLRVIVLWCRKWPTFKWVHDQTLMRKLIESKPASISTIDHTMVNCLLPTFWNRMLLFNFRTLNSKIRTFQNIVHSIPVVNTSCSVVLTRPTKLCSLLTHTHTSLGTSSCSSPCCKGQSLLLNLSNLTPLYTCTSASFSTFVCWLS